MILYADSSAIVAWLFQQPGGDKVVRALDAAEAVVASRLTLLECRRAIVRVEATSAVSASESRHLLDALTRASSEWTLLDIAPDVLDRAAEPFPVEPVRSLDAIHLATMLVVRSTSPGIEALALDERVRRNAVRLGIPLQPT